MERAPAPAPAPPPAPAPAPAPASVRKTTYAEAVGAVAEAEADDEAAEAATEFEDEVAEAKAATEVEAKVDAEDEVDAEAKADAEVKADAEAAAEDEADTEDEAKAAEVGVVVIDLGVFITKYRMIGFLKRCNVRVYEIIPGFPPKGKGKKTAPSSNTYTIELSFWEQEKLREILDREGITFEMFTLPSWKIRYLADSEMYGKGYTASYSIKQTVKHDTAGISFFLNKIGNTSKRNLFCVHSERGATWEFVDE